MFILEKINLDNIKFNKLHVILDDLINIFSELRSERSKIWDNKRLIILPNLKKFQERILELKDERKNKNIIQYNEMMKTFDNIISMLETKY